MMTFTNTKSSLAFAMMLLTAAPQVASAQSSNALSGLYACETLANTDAQLACFRTETAKLRAAETPSRVTLGERRDVKNDKPPASETGVENPRVAQSDVDKPDVDESEKFIPMKKDTTPKSRTLTIRSTATYGANGYVRFTLENGEVWQQIESARIRLGKGSPDMLTIKKASLGSFRGRVNDRRPSFRLKRIK